MVSQNVKQNSILILGILIGAGIYDLAINLKISYNQSNAKMLCQKNIAYEQIEDSTVYLKTKLECINETMKGDNNDNTARENSTQN